MFRSYASVLLFRQYSAPDLVFSWRSAFRCSVFPCSYFYSMSIRRRLVLVVFLDAVLLSRCYACVLLFHFSVIFRLFCQCFGVAPAFRCAVSIPPLIQCSTGVPCSVVLCSSVPGFIVCRFLNNSIRMYSIKLKICILYQISPTFENTIFRYLSMWL